MIWNTLRLQMQLACLGFTLKEKCARMASMDLTMDHDPRLDIGCAQKTRNCLNFFFSRKVPASQL